MKKKILITSILAVFMLLAITLVSAINTSTPVKKKESPLFGIRNRNFYPSIGTYSNSFSQGFRNTPTEILVKIQLEHGLAFFLLDEVPNIHRWLALATHPCPVCDHDNRRGRREFVRM